jgi:Fe-S oxidoreductase
MKLDPRVEAQTDTCAYCPKLCRFSCPAAAGESRETVTPWGLMSLLRAVRLEHVELNAEVGEVFFHCAGCMRCQSFCKHENDVAEGMYAARGLLVERGVPLPRALQGLDLRFERDGSSLGPAPALPASWREVFDPGASVAFFPSAERRVWDPEGVVAVGRLLEAALGHKVALLEGSSEAPLHDCGEALRQAGYGAAAQAWRARLAQGAEPFERVVVESAALVGEGGLERAAHVLEVLHESLPRWSPRLLPWDEARGRKVVFHDACEVGRRAGLYDTPRALLRALVGEGGWEELWLHRREALCCGAGAHYPTVAPEGAAEAARLVEAAAVDQGGELLVTGSLRCARHMGGRARELVGLLAGCLGA